MRPPSGLQRGLATNSPSRVSSSGLVSPPARTSAATARASPSSLALYSSYSEIQLWPRTRSAERLSASGMKRREDYDKTIHPEKALGVFIRELVGLDRHAAKEAFAEFLDATRMNSTQIQFINTLIDYFTQNGVMEPQHLALPPFSDIHSNSLFALFDEAQVKVLTERIRWINQNAEAANDEMPMLKAAEPKPRSYGQ